MELKSNICCLIMAAFFLSSGCVARKAVPQATTATGIVAGAGYHGSYPRVIDIQHTSLDLSFNWDSAFVNGKATISARPYFYPSDQMIVDANGFRINSVALVRKDEKVPLKYSYNGKKLAIQLDKPYSREQKFTIFIDYTAMPERLRIGEDIASAGDRGFYFINREGKDKEKPRQIWTQGETECNSSWFPTINDPQEKMSQDLNITVPNEYVTLSNGSLEYSSLNGDGTRTDSWRQEQPHSTYLTMLAVGNFTITKDKWRDKEVNYYTEPRFASTAKLVFGKTPEMMEFFSRKLGVDFPWDKYSQIVARDFVSGAMENTTATVFFEPMNMTEGQYLDENHEDIISHELFHHWFGDMVTAESWANLPLNESFATYGEYLWEEFKYGRETADLKGFEDVQAYLQGARKKQVDVIRFNYSDREQMFDEVTYQKGGCILHMLRKTVGDEAFFKALNLYLTRHAFKTAEIHDLRIAFEEVTGLDLNWFFNQWFLASGHPVLSIQNSFDAEKKQVVLTIKQVQDLSKTPLYRLPMAVDIYKDGKAERHEITLDQKEQTFAFAASAAPDLVNADADKYLLAEKNEVKPLGQWVFQYQKGPLFMDRLEALIMLQTLREDALARKTVMEALTDKSWALRQVAVEFIRELPPSERDAYYQNIRQMAVKDDVSHVRAAAVKILGKVFGAMDNAEVFAVTANDKAPSVVKATLEARKK